MNRRDVMRRAIGLPVIFAGVVPVSQLIELDAGSVKANMEVFDKGSGRCFALTLMAKPWPNVGDRVAFNYKAIHLRGTVTSFTTEQMRGTDRTFYHIEGTAQEYDADAVQDRP